MASVLTYRMCDTPLVTTVDSVSGGPEPWAVPPPHLLNDARRKALDALATSGSRPVQDRLSRFYDIGGGYAGASFALLPPNVPQTITATDLHATTLLSVTIGPGATRRLLETGPIRDRVVQALGDLPSCALAEADADGFAAMDNFYRVIKTALSAPGTKRKNQWVTASKLCARKRPELFPVRDNLVCNYLGLMPPARVSNRRVDWQVFQFLIGDEDILTAIKELPEVVQVFAEGVHLRMDTTPLRLLDAALWTHTWKR